MKDWNNPETLAVLFVLLVSATATYYDEVLILEPITFTVDNKE